MEFSEPVGIFNRPFWALVESSVASNVSLPRYLMMMEKKEMMMEMDKMHEKMDKMMSKRMEMMGGIPKVKCAEEWLKKAIDIHEVHIKDPKTATEASQMEMMDQMKKAYECITGAGSEMRGTPPKNPEEGKKKDEHGH